MPDKSVSSGGYLRAAPGELLPCMRKAAATAPWSVRASPWRWDVGALSHGYSVHSSQIRKANGCSWAYRILWLVPEKFSVMHSGADNHQDAGRRQNLILVRTMQHPLYLAYMHVMLVGQLEVSRSLLGFM